MVGAMWVALYTLPLLIGAVAALSALWYTGSGLSDTRGGVVAIVCGFLCIAVMYLRLGRLDTSWLPFGLIVAGALVIAQSRRIRAKVKRESGDRASG